MPKRFRQGFREGFLGGEGDVPRGELTSGLSSSSLWAGKAWEKMTLDPPTGAC